MPKNSKLRKPRARAQKGRTHSRRGTQTPASSSLPSVLSEMKLSPPLFPVRFRKRLRYTEIGITQGSGAAGIGGTYFFSANGLFDPNITGVGHQPMGFDQMMLMYNHYTVLSSRILVKAINGGTYAVYTGIGLYLSPDTTNITAVDRLMENGLLTYKYMTPVGGAAANTSFADSNNATLTLACNIPAYFARDRKPREIVEDDQLSGTSAANPTEQVYFGILVFEPTFSNATSAYLLVNLEYDVIFWEPKKLTQS